jgi:hypothetical protein
MFSIYSLLPTNPFKADSNLSALAFSASALAFSTSTLAFSAFMASSALACSYLLTASNLAK